jgi:hypothetical protein
MDRRTFMGSVAGGLLAAPLAARAQQVGKVYRIGILETNPRHRTPPNSTPCAKGCGTSDTSKGETWSSNIDRQMDAPSGSRTSRPNWSVSRSA